MNNAKKMVLVISTLFLFLLSACNSEQGKQKEKIEETVVQEDINTTEEPEEIKEIDAPTPEPVTGIWLITKETHYPVDNPDYKSVWEYPLWKQDFVNKNIQLYKDNKHFIDKWLKKYNNLNDKCCHFAD